MHESASREPEDLRSRMLRHLRRRDHGAARPATSLAPEERALLESAQANGGCLRIGGLPEAELVRHASIALMLEQRGLLRMAIRFGHSVPIRPEEIAIALTDAGARSLQMDWYG